MKIAFIGTRGIPANHGGFETCVEEIGERLVHRGHQVTAYSKRAGRTRKSTYKGIEVVYIPRLPVPGVETVLAAAFAAVHSLWTGHDVHMVFDSANAPVLVLLRLCRARFAINPDGLGWQREKWGRLARAYYKWVEGLLVRITKNIVTDSHAMQRYYQKVYGAASVVIEYGANEPSPVTTAEESRVLGTYGLSPYGYFLQVTRFEPENNPHLTASAFLQVDTDMSLLLVGGASNRNSYYLGIEHTAKKCSRIVTPGFVYDRHIVDILWQKSFAYVHGNGVGGTNPALLQAMAAGRPILALDCEFNRETLEDHARFFQRTTNDLTSAMRWVLHNREAAENDSVSALERIREVYTWERITARYEGCFKNLLSSECRMSTTSP